MVLIPDTYASVSIALRHSLQARPTAITFGVSASLATDPSAIANTLMADFFTRFKGSFDSSVTMGPTTVRLGVGGGDPVVGLSTSGGGQATAIKQSMPPNVALIVRKVTARGGRRGRGRMFWPWCLSVNDVNEDGTLTSSFTGPFDVLLGQWRSALSSAGFPMCILHSAGRTSTGSPDLVTGVSTVPLVGTQKRRLGR